MRPALEEFRSAVAALGELTSEPRGTLRLVVAYGAEREFSVAVPTRVLTTDPLLLVRLALTGVGLAMLFESQVQEYLARRELVAVLEPFSTPFPGFYLYYPQRRHASPALRAFVDFIRGTRSTSRATPGGRRRDLHLDRTARTSK